MLRQNPSNPCQLLQEVPEGSGNWIPVFDVSLCNPQYLNGTPGLNNQTKRCNIASMLVDVTLRDAVEAELTAKESTSGLLGLISTLTALSVSITGLSTLGVLLLGTAGVSTVANFLIGADTAQIRTQLTNAYWLDVKQALY